MSLASSSSSALRSVLRNGARPAVFGSRFASGYAPQITDELNSTDRPPRPDSPQFFTGRPQYSAALDQLQSTLQSAQLSLRKSLIYPLPPSLSPPQAPRTSFLNSTAMSSVVGLKLKARTHRAILEILNELHQMRHLAELSGKGDVVDMIARVVSRFEREDSEQMRGATKEEPTIDALGRAYGSGRRKTSSAQVWLVPNPKAAGILDAASALEASDASVPIPTSEVLVNHLPMSQHFARETDHATVLRPLKLTGLLGAYNIFALVQGGGTTGQAGAVALAVARALKVMRDDVSEVLRNDGALRRDPRMVERKKTGQPKARKKYTWVKR